MKKAKTVPMVHFLAQARRGLEKESLRIGPAGSLALTPHPPSLGAALTHPTITTDYAEALLECMTPPLSGIEPPLNFLHELHQWVYGQLGSEKLWTHSMPCQLPRPIPIADYGSSHLGQLKKIYRRGLSFRYGETMQAIAGIHYNFSLPPEFWRWEKEQKKIQASVSQRYFDLIRNLQRHLWIATYLFGASPAFSSSFLTPSAAEQKKDLQPWKKNSFIGPFATSLRLSGLGYHNHLQKELSVSFNSLASYTADLLRLTQTPYPPYQQLGVHRGGEYLQLNDHFLQNENEFYGLVRPKRKGGIEDQGPTGERPLATMQRLGVEYIELRNIDLNPFLPLGVDQETLRFLDLMILYCLDEDSPPMTPEEEALLRQQNLLVAMEGRRPHLQLPCGQLQDQAKLILERLMPFAEALDKGEGKKENASTLWRQLEKIRYPELTPSAKILQEMREQQQEFLDFGLHWAEKHGQYFRERPLSAAKNFELTEQSAQSHAEQALREKEDQGTSLAQALSQYLALPSH
jgi:glutamate--cysteine ligase